MAQKADLTGVFVVPVTVDVGNLTTVTDTDTVFTVPGVLVGVDVVLQVNPPPAIAYGVSVVGAYVTANNQVTARLANFKAADVDPASGVWTFIIGRQGG